VTISACSIDTCFLVDWALYSKRDLLFRAFQYCYIVEDVMDEVRSERTVEFLAEGLANGFFVIYPFRRDLEAIVREIITTTDPRVRRLDPPEAYALAIGLREGVVVLTENKGALALVKYVEKYRGITVWRSYELLVELARRGLINLNEELTRYERETGHRFPRARNTAQRG